MSKSVFFNRECPTCGRRLLILVEYLGKRVVCPHCGGKLDAVQPGGEWPVGDSGRSLLERADELLQSRVEPAVSSVRAPHPR